MTNELRELLESYHCKDVVTQDLINRIDAEFQRLQQDKSDLLALLVDARKEIELLRAIVANIHLNTEDANLLNLDQAQWKLGIVHRMSSFETGETGEG